MNNSNVGISFLKVTAMFGVVYMHFGSDSSMLLHTTVPIFMLTSFYLAGAKLSMDGWKVLGNRIMRLYLPFAFWGGGHALLLVLFEGGSLVRVCVPQLLIGVPACPPLYFSCLLLVNTILLFVVIRLFKRWTNWALAVMGGIALWLQYSGINHLIFGRFSLHVASALGRFAELLPAAICGYWLQVSLNFCRSRIIMAMSVLMIGLSSFLISFACLGTPGFGYQGLPLLLLSVGTCSLIIASCNKIRLPSLARLLRRLSDYMAGVYYVHLLVGKSLEHMVGRHRGMFEVILVYLLSVLFVATLNKIKFLRWCVK